MSRLSIHLLGPFYVTLDEEPVTEFESNKVRALLAYLAVEADRPHSRDELIGLLWPDQPERTARRNLSQALFNLRRTIRDDDVTPPFLHVTRRAVQFNLESDQWLDVAQFVVHIAASETHAHSKLEACKSCIQHLEQADALYQGEFLAGFFVDDSGPFGEWGTLRRERFHRQVLDAQYHLARHYERRRNYERARHYARRQVELEPWREEAHQQLMRLLVRSGQRSAALQQYEICHRILADELGVEPTDTTTRLYRRIRSVPSIGAHNLPPQATPFVGRASELRDTGGRLVDPDCRLLTLTGAGGIGKTRLAIQAAHENRAAFLHGVCFVPLAPLQSTEFLVPTIASALQLPLHSEMDPKEQLLDALRECEMLLLFDNFEHLIEDGVDLLAMAHNFNNLGAVAYWAGDYAEAKQRFLESKAIFEELGDPGRAAMAINNAGEMCVALGEDESATRYLLEALRTAVVRHLPRLPFNTLYALAALLKRQGRPIRAYELAIFVKRHPMTEWSVHQDLRPLLAELETTLPSEVQAAAEERAKKWTLNDVAAEMLAEAEGGDA
jgi:DNA-binding SARP family transcriptional activator